MDEKKERQKEIKEKLEDAGLDPDLSACEAQAGEFDEDEQPACAEPACWLGRGFGGQGRTRRFSLIKHDQNHSKRKYIITIKKCFDTLLHI